MWTWDFWRQAIERAVKTGAQVAAALLGVAGLGILDVDWKSVGSVVALAVVASFVTSLATGELGQAGTPSVVPVPLPGEDDEPAVEEPRDASWY